MDAEVTVEKATKYTPYGLAQLGGHRGIMSLLERYRQKNMEQSVQVDSLSLEHQPGRISSPVTVSEPVSLPATTLTSPPGEPSATAPMTAQSQTTDTMEPVDTTSPTASPDPASQTLPDNPLQATKTKSPLDMVKDKLIQEILRKLDQDNLESLEGIRLTRISHQVMR